MIKFTILENAVGHLTEEKKMGKKRTRKKLVSKGTRVNQRLGLEKTSASKMINKIEAWAKGLPVMLTVANPNKSETNKPFIRVKADHYWGSATARRPSKSH